MSNHKCGCPSNCPKQKPDCQEQESDQDQQEQDPRQMDLPIPDLELDRLRWN